MNIDLYDISGRKISNIYKGNINGEEVVTYDVSNLSTGLYLVKIYNDKNNIIRKVVVE
ncbi:MAG: T9SS type A sorting domain-containing protein [bacterium]